ncbi:hypothetical protein B9T29_04405 [Acinetobacter sp. ANC 3903]|uniref:hypothetical protein n=1 Tax=Acinetobacter sp. ANC 3903 TaxID=1977883 RepID=UPI000A352AD1|nr:hypothetical protein [Acinetobacter sp. ANC 3903]OTG63408.1 hypothetical protein B9T29_04405 [Acinetobacter sp. ANC 3903]
MNTHVRKAIIYRYWHISILLLTAVFFVSYYFLDKHLGSAEIKLNGWAQILALPTLLSPIAYLVSNYQKINESKDIKGISVLERNALRGIINQRCSDILYTVLLATLISIVITGYSVFAQQNSELIKPMKLSLFLSIIISYVVTCFFWIYSAFLAISELTDYKSDIQQRIDKDGNKENFEKLLRSDD